MTDTIRCQACNAAVLEENIQLTPCGCSVCLDCSKKPVSGGTTCPQCRQVSNELAQIKPCGCSLCRNCLIQWLTATRMETDWVCWGCGTLVDTHTGMGPARAANPPNGSVVNGAAGKKKAAPRKKSTSPVKKRKRIPTNQKEIVDSLMNPSPSKPGKKERKKRLTFAQRLQALLKYKEVHGNINVPWRYDGDGNLGEWVKNVRRGVKKLSLDERKQLNALGFSWETKRNKFDREWKERLERLKAYKRRFGDCYVPWQWEEDKQLAEVSTLRMLLVLFLGDAIAH